MLGNQATKDVPFVLFMLAAVIVLSAMPGSPQHLSQDAPWSG
jgi:hypothetical protein